MNIGHNFNIYVGYNAVGICHNCKELTNNIRIFDKKVYCIKCFSQITTNKKDSNENEKKKNYEKEVY